MKSFAILEVVYDSINHGRQYMNKQRRHMLPSQVQYVSLADVVTYYWHVIPIENAIALRRICQFPQHNTTSRLSELCMQLFEMHPHSTICWLLPTRPSY